MNIMHPLCIGGTLFGKKTSVTRSLLPQKPGVRV
jgi:hypothetical protein